MQKIKTMIVLLFAVLMASSLFAQGPHHNSSHHGLWPDSLQTITVTGTVMVDTTFFHPLYYLDENNDGNADYHLAFGPFWYEPESGATRPEANETVTIVGTIHGHMLPPTLMVFEIDGLTWREPVQYGMHGWNGDPLWNVFGDTVTVTGVVMVDTTYFYDHYFLDVDNDTLPEYKLGFGPPWYEPTSGATRPQDGETVSLFGRLHSMMGIDLLSVYKINGLEWRPLDQPAPWGGTWMHRNHSDTSFAYCVTDSTNWIGFAPGHMGMGMMWPNSVFVQFWEIHPDSLPGIHNDEYFKGFYMNVQDPSGLGMMDGRFGGRHGMMQFQKEQQFQFHYYDDELEEMGLSEDGMIVKYWDADMLQWRSVSSVSIDQQSNIVTFTSSDLSNYYTLSATASVTGVDESTAETVPTEFVLQQNYPNPFNPSTTIRFEVPVQSQVQLSVYNLLGQRIAVLLNENKAAGVYAVQWNGQDDHGRTVSSGIYLIKLDAGSQTQIRRMTLLK